METPDAGSGGESPADESGLYSQQYRHTPVAARVPEHVARAAITTGVLVLDTPTEFVLDFLQSLTRPHQVVARVVLAPVTMQQFVASAADNLSKYVATHGQPLPMPRPPQRRPTLAEVYENFKLTDEQLSGAYANSYIIGHSPAEFFVDFITSFFPHAAVSARLVLAAPHMPRVVETLTAALQNYRKRHGPPIDPSEQPE